MKLLLLIGMAASLDCGKSIRAVSGKVESSGVLPASVAGIHGFLAACQRRKTRMARTNVAMIPNHDSERGGSGDWELPRNQQQDGPVPVAVAPWIGVNIRFPVRKIRSINADALNFPHVNDEQPIGAGTVACV
jgi:hypothetical protein